MPQEQSLVEQQIQALGKFDRFMIRKEIKHLPEILRNGENIHAMTSGRYKNQNWLIIVTDQRILCLYKFLFKMKQVELPISQISGIGYSTGMFFGEIVATTSGGIEKFDMIQKADVNNVASTLSEIVSLRSQGLAPQKKVAPLPQTSTNAQPEKGTTRFSFQRKKPATLTQKIFGVVGFAFLSLVIIGNLNSNKTSSADSQSQQTSTPQNTGPLSASEKAYGSSIYDYQTRQNAIGTTVAHSLVGLNTGETNLNDVHEVIKTASIDTEMAFETYYVKQADVPPAFVNVDKKIRKSYDLRMASYKEYLKSWADADMSHIPRAQNIFMQSEAIAQEASKDFEKALTKIKTASKSND